MELRPPKYGSERVVYLADDLVQILARQVEGCDVWLFEGQGNDPLHQLVTSNVPTARMVQVDQWQVDPHRKRGNALRSGSDAAAGLCRCIRCNNPAVCATKSDATSWHPMQPRMVISWSGA